MDSAIAPGLNGFGPAQLDVLTELGNGFHNPIIDRCRPERRSEQGFGALGALLEGNRPEQASEWRWRRER